MAVTPETSLGIKVDLNRELMTAVERYGGFTNAHAHPSRFGTFTEKTRHLANAPFKQRWDALDRYKRETTPGQFYDRMAEYVDLMAKQGVTAIGFWIDVDEASRDKEIIAAQRLIQTFPRGQGIDLVFINQTLKGVVDDEAYRWFRVGAEFADIVGGLPGRDQTRKAEHMRRVVGTAREFGKRVHVHVDQFNTYKENESELLARTAISLDKQGEVVGVHGISLAAHSLPVRLRTYEKMREAGIMMVACPTAWIDSGNNEETAPTHSAITPIRELMEQGILVAAGLDNHGDIYLPDFDRTMLEEARFTRNHLRFYSREGVDQIARIFSTNGRLVLGLSTKVDLNGHSVNGQLPNYSLATQ